jgi:hypothetical protein
MMVSTNDPHSGTREVVCPKYDCILFVNLTEAGSANTGIIIHEGKRLLVDLDLEESIILK